MVDLMILAECRDRGDMPCYWFSRFVGPEIRASALGLRLNMLYV